MADESYQTHVGLVLHRKTEGGVHRVSIVGERDKTLYEGTNELEAKRTFKEIKDHYEERKQKAEEDVAAGREGNNATERKVELVNRRAGGNN